MCTDCAKIVHAIVVRKVARQQPPTCVALEAHVLLAPKASQAAPAAVLDPPHTHAITNLKLSHLMDQMYGCMYVCDATAGSCVSQQTPPGRSHRQAGAQQVHIISAGRLRYC